MAFIRKRGKVWYVCYWYDLEGRLAVSLAVEHAKANSPFMRPKSTFEDELKRLLGSSPSQEGFQKTEY